MFGFKERDRTSRAAVFLYRRMEGVLVLRHDGLVGAVPEP